MKAMCCSWMFLHIVAAERIRHVQRGNPTSVFHDTKSWSVVECEMASDCRPLKGSREMCLPLARCRKAHLKSLPGRFLAGRFSNEDSHHTLILNEHPIMIAKTFADAFTRFGGESSNTLHIYDDGYVLSIACSSDRHLSIREILLEEYGTIDEARSSDGFLSVFVVRCNTADQQHPIMVATTDGYNDHRQDDLNTIDIAAEWFEQGKRLASGS